MTTLRRLDQDVADDQADAVGPPGKGKNLVQFPLAPGRPEEVDDPIHRAPAIIDGGDPSGHDELGFKLGLYEEVFCRDADAPFFSHLDLVENLSHAFHLARQFFGLPPILCLLNRPCQHHLSLVDIGAGIH